MEPLIRSRLPLEFSDALGKGIRHGCCAVAIGHIEGESRQNEPNCVLNLTERQGLAWRYREEAEYLARNDARRPSQDGRVSPHVGDA